MTFAGSFDDNVLPPDHREALEAACTVLVDDFLDDTTSLRDNPEDWDDTFLSNYLPRRFRRSYTPVFAREFQVCTVVVGWKLAQDQWLAPACLGEALALNALVVSAAVRLEDEGVEPDFAPFMDAALSGIDVGDLFADAAGGVGESELGRRLERAEITVVDWFNPFPSATTAVQPYLVGPADYTGEEEYEEDEEYDEDDDEDYEDEEEDEEDEE